MDGFQEITDYDDADEYTSFSESTGSARGGLAGSGGSAPRKKGKKNLASKAQYDKGRSMGRGFSLDPRNIASSAGSLAGISIIAALLCVLILFLTFYQKMIPAFYGSLAASVIVVFTLAYITSRLLN